MKKRPSSLLALCVLALSRSEASLLTADSAPVCGHELREVDLCREQLATCRGESAAGAKAKLKAQEQQGSPPAADAPGKPCAHELREVDLCREQLATCRGESAAGAKVKQLASATSPPGAAVVHARTYVSAALGSATAPKSLLPEDSSTDADATMAQMRGVCEDSCLPGKEPVCPAGARCTGCRPEACDINGCSCNCECETRGWMLGGHFSQSMPLCTSNPKEDAVCVPAMTDAEQGGKGLPSQGRVAVLIRGQAFRDGTKQSPTCLEAAKHTQFEAVQSLYDKVIGPLEARGNGVDLFVSEPSGCGKELMDELAEQYNAGTHASERRVKWFDFETRLEGQARSTRHAVRVFREHHEVPIANYSLVLMTRHDVLWKVPITTWQGSVDFRRVNFLSRCEVASPYGVGCVDDIIHVMPGRLFESFSDAVNANGCFSTLEGEGADDAGMFACLNEITNHTNMSAALITDWRPDVSLRDNNAENPVAVTFPVETRAKKA